MPERNEWTTRAQRMNVRSAREPLDIDPLRPQSAMRSAIQSDYESLKPSQQTGASYAGVAAAESTAKLETLPRSTTSKARVFSSPFNQPESALSPRPITRLKRGHGLTYAGLFLFTIVLYTRPAEFYPSPLTASIALIIALATLAFFLPTQLALEGTLTARPPEVNLVLLFCLTALLSSPLAINPTVAWREFSSTFIRCIIMFILIVNVVRTKARLNGLLFLALASSLWLSVEAINQYRQGLMLIEGYRASGKGSGIFGNTNDMALHVVTVFPIAIAFLFDSKGVARKLFYGVCAALLLGGIILSYSRGAFLTLIVVTIFLVLRIGPRHRLGLVLLVVALAGAALLLAPDKYGGRLLSIFDSSLDPGGSADARRGELWRSLYIAIRHPLLGIGMGNYQAEMSYRGLVTHNSYTQVAAEMGAAALGFYTMFIVAPLRKLGQIGRETFEARGNSNYYYLAVGLQASLLGYLVCSFFLSVAYVWYVYYLVAFAVCLRRLYEAETGRAVVVEKRKERKQKKVHAPLLNEVGAVLR
jgi:hypothetical protein